MRIGGWILSASVIFALFLLLAAGVVGTNEGSRAEAQGAVEQTLCGGAYDCQSMPGTCCCLCGMNYGCLDRSECEQNPGCRCRQPTPEKIEGEANWPGQESSDNEGP